MCCNFFILRGWKNLEAEERAGGGRDPELGRSEAANGWLTITLPGYDSQLVTENVRESSRARGLRVGGLAGGSRTGTRIRLLSHLDFRALRKRFLGTS